MTYRFTADNPQFIYDDVLGRVIGIRHPGGQEEYFGLYGATSGLRPPATLGSWRAIAASAVAASVTGTTSETTLATITIPGGSMGANGFVRVTSLWSYTNSANNKIVRARFGGTAVASNTLTTTASAPLNFTIGNRNSQSSQVAGVATGLVNTTANAVNTPTINTANDVALVLNGVLANTGETITLESYLVEALFQA
jgi:hypothetical protein